MEEISPPPGSGGGPGATWWPTSTEGAALLAGSGSGEVPDDEYPEFNYWGFAPPPPRPPYFPEDDVQTDGVTTCDLCTWARHKYVMDQAGGKIEPVIGGELSWVLTLVIVSIASAILGAVVMVVALHWKKFKNSEINGSSCIFFTTSGSPSLTESQTPRQRPPAPSPSTDKRFNTSPPSSHALNQSQARSTGVWAWLTSNKTPGDRPNLKNPPNTASIGNHYTHMDEPYSTVEEAVYAELDSNCPAYENTGYNETEPDNQASSGQSSAYYSDLSVTTTVPERPERAYEVVGLTVISGTQQFDVNQRRCHRLEVINESNVAIPSDYV